MKILRRETLAALGAGLGIALTAIVPPLARAAEPVPVVTTFSIIGDIVKNIGGSRVSVTTLVGPDGDTHVYSPTPRDAQAVAEARLIFANGLGFEGWMDRLTQAAGSHGRVVVVSDGVEPLVTDRDDDYSLSHRQADKDEHGHKDEHGEEHNEHAHGPVDPHAWHDLSNARIYADNIAAALSDIDPAGRRVYEANRNAYTALLDALDAEAQAMLAALPGAPHRVVVPHAAFGYLERAYGIEFASPQGFGTEAEASAKDVANLIRQIRAQNVDALFLENVADTRLIEQIERETDAFIGGTLYSGALSGPDGPAPTYVAMMRHNIQTLADALRAKASN